MTGAAVGLFVLGLAASWVAGRYLTAWAQVVQGGAIGLCGVLGSMIGFPQLWQDSFLRVVLILLGYGLVGALLFRAGQAAARRGGGDA